MSIFLLILDAKISLNPSDIHHDDEDVAIDKDGLLDKEQIGKFKLTLHHIGNGQRGTVHVRATRGGADSRYTLIEIVILISCWMFMLRFGGF